MIPKPPDESLEQRVRVLEKENKALLEAYRRIEDSEKLYRITLENISDTVLITDDIGKIIYVCPNTSIIFGFSQSEVYRLGSVHELLKGKVCDVSVLKRKKEVIYLRQSRRLEYVNRSKRLFNGPPQRWQACYLNRFS